MEFYVMITLALFFILVFWHGCIVRARNVMKIGDIYYRLKDDNPFLEPQYIKIIDIKDDWCQYMNYDRETKKEYGSIYSCHQNEVTYHMKKYEEELK